MRFGVVWGNMGVCGDKRLLLVSFIRKTSTGYGKSEKASNCGEALPCRSLQVKRAESSAGELACLGFSAHTLAGILLGRDKNDDEINNGRS